MTLHDLILFSFIKKCSSCLKICCLVFITLTVISNTFEMIEIFTLKLECCRPMWKIFKFFLYIYQKTLWYILALFRIIFDLFKSKLFDIIDLCAYWHLYKDKCLSPFMPAMVISVWWGFRGGGLVEFDFRNMRCYHEYDLFRFHYSLAF